MLGKLCLGAGGRPGLVRPARDFLSLRGSESSNLFSGKVSMILELVDSFNSSFLFSAFILLVLEDSFISFFYGGEALISLIIHGVKSLSLLSISTCTSTLGAIYSLLSITVLFEGPSLGAIS